MAVTKVESHWRNEEIETMNSEQSLPSDKCIESHTPGGITVIKEVPKKIHLSQLGDI